MKRTIPFLLLFGFCIPSWSAAEDTSKEKGTILILDNDELIEGEITKVGQGYQVKRGVGETTIPADRVVLLVADKKTAYKVICERTNLRDPDERIRLAKWCLLYKLNNEAQEQLEATLKLRSKDNEAQVMLQNLKSILAKKDVLPAKATETTTPKELPKAVVQIDTKETPTYNRDSFGMFANKVQPLLMNTCVRCHQEPYSGSFLLVRVFEASSDRKGTVANLNAVLKQLNREKPTESMLLKKSVQIHGDPPIAPLKTTSSPAYRMLTTWVVFAMSEEGSPMPQLEMPTKPSASANNEETVFRVDPEIFLKNKTTETSEPAFIKREPIREQKATEAKPKDQGHVESKSSEGKDDFDPDIFNKQNAPKKK